MLTRRELAAAITGVVRLLRWDETGFACFEATLDGFWRSFWAAAILAPFTAAILLRQVALAPSDSSVHYVLFRAIGYVIGWLAYPLAMTRISQFLGRRERYFTYMVAYNWFHLVEIVAWGPLALLDAFGLLPGEAEALLSLLILGVLLAYEWFLARRGLRVEGGTAAALVVIDLLLDLMIDRVSDALA